MMLFPFPLPLFPALSFPIFFLGDLYHPTLISFPSLFPLSIHTPSFIHSGSPLLCHTLLFFSSSTFYGVFSLLSFCQVLSCTLATPFSSTCHPLPSCSLPLYIHLRLLHLSHSFPPFPLSFIGSLLQKTSSPFPSFWLYSFSSPKLYSSLTPSFCFNLPFLLPLTLSFPLINPAPFLFHPPKGRYSDICTLVVVDIIRSAGPYWELQRLSVVCLDSYHMRHYYYCNYICLHLGVDCEFMVNI